MSFSNPSAFVLLLFVFFLAVLAVGQERIRYQQMRLLGMAWRTDAHHAHRISLIWWLMALVFLVLALARPVWGVDILPVNSQNFALVAVLDVSKSMDADDIHPTRLERAKLDLRQIIRQLNGNWFALVIFADSAVLQSPLTIDQDTSELFVQNVSTAALTGQGTNTEKALQVALDVLVNATAKEKVILLLSDGENQTGSPLLAAGAARSAGVRIDALGYGTVDGSAIPLLDEFGNLAGYKEDQDGNPVRTMLDENNLRSITEVAKGVYLKRDSIGLSIELLTEFWNMDQPHRSQGNQTRPREHFPLFVGIAIVCLTLERLLWLERGRA